MGSKSKQKSSSTTTNPFATQQYNAARQALSDKSYTPLTGEQITGYMNPFTSSVIDANLARSRQDQQLALNANADAATRAGAFGGTGLDVANALTRGQFDLNNQQMMAGLNAANYAQALQTAQGENQMTQQYPILVQQLLGQLAQGTQQNSTGKSSSSTLSMGWNPMSGFSFGG